MRSTARFKFQKSQKQVWNSLKALKKTATGPDLIPYWVWRDHVEIFTPLIAKIWKLSLLPRAGHRLGNKRISLLYRGISVTPVIARVFEKTVYRNHAQEAIE